MHCPPLQGVPMSQRLVCSQGSDIEGCHGWVMEGRCSRAKCMAGKQWKCKQAHRASAAAKAYGAVAAGEARCSGGVLRALPAVTRRANLADAGLQKVRQAGGARSAGMPSLACFPGQLPMHCSVPILLLDPAAGRLTAQVLPPKPVGQLLHLKPGAAAVSCVHVPPLHGVPALQMLVCTGARVWLRQESPQPKHAAHCTSHFPKLAHGCQSVGVHLPPAPTNLAIVTSEASGAVGAHVAGRCGGVLGAGAAGARVANAADTGL